MQLQILSSFMFVVLVATTLLMAKYNAMSGEEDSDFNRQTVKIVNPGATLNTAGLEYGVSTTPDGLFVFFVSDRVGSYPIPEEFRDNSSNVKLSHDIYLAVKSDPTSLGFDGVFNIDPPNSAKKLGVNTERNEGIVSVAYDRKTIFFVGCNRPDGAGDCDIYGMVVDMGPGHLNILTVYNLGQAINTEYFESMPSLSPDLMRLYFVSNRPRSARMREFSRLNGGFQPISNDIDIWYADFDTVENTWKPAVHAGNVINSDGVDWSPFIAADNKTLFFASDGHDDNIGGSDLYYSVLAEDGSWSEPVNLGEPINTDKHEMSFTMTATGEIAYLASQRIKPPSTLGNYDIFMALTPNILQEITTIAWRQVNAASVSIDIYDHYGEIVRTYAADYSEGRHVIEWDGSNNNGVRLPPGTYTCYITVGEKDEAPRMLVIH